jgi:hypothetical protein
MGFSYIAICVRAGRGTTVSIHARVFGHCKSVVPGLESSINIHEFQFLHYPLLEFCGVLVVDVHVGSGKEFNWLCYSEEISLEGTSRNRLEGVCADSSF